MSFAAHVDFTQNWSFIERVRPANIVLVHGEKKTMELLKVHISIGEVLSFWSLVVHLFSTTHSQHLLSTNTPPLTLSSPFAAPKHLTLSMYT